MGIEKKYYTIMALFVIAVMTVTSVSAALLQPFTQEELDDNWVADRQYPSGGVDSVSFAGRDNVARIGVIAEEQASDSFRHFEGIKKVEDFGTHVQADLYVPSEWQDADVVNVGFWASDDPITAYPLIVYRNSAAVDAGFYTWDGVGGYDYTGLPVNYDDWNTLAISLDTANGIANYFINGDAAGSIAATGDNIGQVFLNHYNDGVRDYYAYWHIGLVELPPARAAPAVASDLLNEADISNRYGQGRNGGNHISDVAHAMGSGTDFNGVAKEDVMAYECEIVKFLRGKDVPAMVLASSECYNFVEQVEVDSADIEGASSEASLAEGAEYLFVASGTWQNANLHTVDAECRLPTSETEWELSAPRSLRLQVDEQYVEWGTSCAPDNVYELNYMGMGDTVAFRIVDGMPPVPSWYNDNVGSLFVDIYEKLW
ncbi:MAG: hypothetical protein ACMXYL_04095 [Candidatus Woesearchaeota archaeon]